jgi:hypothetical protein
VKDLGNVAAHSAQKTITETDFLSALQNLLPVLRWYEREYQSIATDEVANGSREIDRDAEKENRCAEKTVILAGYLLGSEIDDEWDAIRKFLINDGVTVVSDNVLPAHRARFPNAVFLQLFGTLDRLDQARQQFGKWELEDGSNRTLRWRKTLPNPRIDAQVLKSLDEEDRRLCEGARTGLFEEFKLAVRDRLQELMEPPDPDAMPRLKPYLYITADRSNKTDYGYAGRLQDAARRYADVDVMKDGKEGEQRLDFKEALKIAAGIVFLYGDTQPKFIENWLSFYKREKQLFLMKMRKNPKIGPPLNVKLTALYDAPPGAEEKRQIRPLTGIADDELPVYGSRDTFTINDVEKICTRLLR